MVTAPRRLGYGWIADDVLKGTVLNRGYFFFLSQMKIEHLKWLHLTPLLYAEILFSNFCFASYRKHSRCEMYVITWSIVSIDISAEDSPTSLQCLTALLSELWTLIFLHNYEKWIFWCSFSACPPGKAHTETQSCYSIGRQFKAVVVLDSLQGLVFECGTLVKNDWVCTVTGMISTGYTWLFLLADCF